MDLLNLSQIINDCTKKRKQGISVGEYVTLAVINRIAEPCSKNALAGWYEDTWLSRKFKYDPKSLTSQAYWNNLKCLNQEAISAIEIKLNEFVLKFFKINLECLLYDPTNFHTFIKTFKRGELPKRGKAKSGRNDLNLVALSLVVTKDKGIPIMHQTYTGNTFDSKHFESFIPAFIERCKALNQECKGITLVFDKGNNSAKNIKALESKELESKELEGKDLEGKRLNYIASLKPSSFKHLLAVPKSDFVRFSLLKTKKEIHAHETTDDVFNKPDQRVIMTKNKKREKRSVILLLKKIDFIVKELLELRAKLNTHVWKRRDRVEKKVKEFLSREAGKCLKVQVLGPNGALSMSIVLDCDMLEAKREAYGRTLLTTNRADWTAAEVIETYRQQYIVETQFKEMKCVDSIRTTPMYCWTDPKIRAHMFICVVALMVKCVVRELLIEKGFHLSHKKIKKNLERIRLVTGKSVGGKKFQQLASMSGLSKELADALSLPDLL
ncbi:MAG: IS1634 family transposase [Promethearchaeota archaeon]